MLTLLIYVDLFLWLIAVDIHTYTPHCLRIMDQIRPIALYLLIYVDLFLCLLDVAINFYTPQWLCI